MAKEMIWIGSDHGGYELKLRIVQRLSELGFSVHDVGSHSTEIVRYPYYATRVAGAVSRGGTQRGMHICSTGIGMSIVADNSKASAQDSARAPIWRV